MHQRVPVLFGTETGNSQECADMLAAAIVAAGIPAESIDMGTYPTAQLEQEPLVFIITSTFGNGDPPANAQVLLDYVTDAKTQLHGLRYGVCGLGDTTYPMFAQCGRDFDERLELRGGERVVERVDCDGGFDFEIPFEEFRDSVLAYLAEQWESIASSAEPNVSDAVASTAAEVAAPELPGSSRSAPYSARLKQRLRLSSEGSAKETVHYSIDLGDSGLSYEPGDCFGVYPDNDPAEVEALLAALSLDPGAPVKVASTRSDELDADGCAPLAEVLKRDFCLQRISLDLLRSLATSPGPAEELLAHPDQLHDYAPSHHVLDLVRAHPQAKIEAQQLVDCLRHMSPRLYSIASSQRAHPTEVHFTIDTVRYERHGRSVLGVASTWFADRLSEGDRVPLYLHPNERFRLPTDSRPILMVGPGTGIAPFRAYLEELQSSGRSVKSWLFFGHQHEEHDFLYREELARWIADGTLTRLSLAWSRDQAQKIYVQNRIAEHAREVWDWIEEGASIYVCGDAGAMAPAVRAAFQTIAGEIGGVSDTNSWLQAMEEDGRYCQDVY